MTLAYRPGASLAHRLDPRAKFLFQAGFGVAALTTERPLELLALTALVGVVLAIARTSPVRVLSAYRFALPFLALAPVIQMATLGPPWLVPADGVAPAIGSYRVLLVLLVSGAYVRTTSVRESRAAVQHLVPGRPGQFLGMGTAFVLRFLPLLRADVASVRDAVRARLGSERPLTDRMRLVATQGLTRAFDRADRFGLALRARCFAWNPTLPVLRYTRRDAPVLMAAVGLVVWPVIRAVT